MKKISITVLTAMLMTPGLAAPRQWESDGFPSGVQFGVGLSGTSGLNGFVGYANKNFDGFWAKRFGVRLDFATTSPIKSSVDSALGGIIGDGVELGDGMRIKDGAFSAKHFGALVDFYPFGNEWLVGGWRISAGYMTGRANMNAVLAGDARSEFRLADTSYRYDGNTTGRADLNWEYRGPYVGTGFDLGLFWGVKIFADLGVVFTSKTAAVGLDVPLNEQLEYWNGSAWRGVQLDGKTAEFEQDQAYAIRDANDELGKIKYYPIVKVGFMYRF
jgi:hypothetical protein